MVLRRTRLFTYLTDVLSLEHNIVIIELIHGCLFKKRSLNWMIKAG